MSGPAGNGAKKLAGGVVSGNGPAQAFAWVAGVAGIYTLTQGGTPEVLQFIALPLGLVEPPSDKTGAATGQKHRDTLMARKTSFQEYRNFRLQGDMVEPKDIHVIDTKLRQKGINEKWLKEGSSDYVLRTKSYRPGSNGKDDKGGKTYEHQSTGTLKTDPLRRTKSQLAQDVASGRKYSPFFIQDGEPVRRYDLDQSSSKYRSDGDSWKGGRGQSQKAD